VFLAPALHTPRQRKGWERESVVKKERAKNAS